MSIIYFVIAMSAIICVHELGHLIAAKAFHVYCIEYAIGMGPKIYSKKFKETTFTIRALPVGGFVAMAGEEGNTDLDIPFSRTIKGIAPWKRIIVMVSGVVMNFILAWVIFSSILLINGAYQLSPEAVVGGVVENSPAQSAGFRTGDKIVKVTYSDGSSIQPRDFNELMLTMQTYKDEATYAVERQGQVINIKVTPIYLEAEKRYFIGINIPQGEIVKTNLFNSFGYGAEYMMDTTEDIFNALVRLVRGVGLENLSGPVGIFQVTAQQAQQGLDSYILFIALLSLNVGIFNLLPLPIFDGGRIVITFFEMILRKPMNQKFEYAIMMVSMMLIIGLFIFVTYQDILRLF